ncbi:ABC transporter permease [Agromyces rhizosphaerae]|nr:ABC transporter permease [Agromyces rhizosphaerae]
MFIVRRIVAGAILLFAISILAFTLLYLDSATIARRILGETATEELIARKTAELGLDLPLWQQYLQWLANALQGDLGRSWTNGQLVSVNLADRLSVTLSLVIGTTVLTAIASVVLGILAAQKGGWVDGVIQVITVLGFAIPGFLIALYLVLAFAINLHWFKATGYVPPTDSISGWLASVTLPILALSFGAVAAVTQQIRGAVIDGMSRDYVRTLRSRGLSPASVVYRHVLRNAAGPALAVLALQFIGLLGGSLIVEQVFALPGMGQLTVAAGVGGDIPVVMGVVVVFAIIVIVVNLAIDLAQAALNPKVRLS